MDRMDLYEKVPIDKSSVRVLEFPDCDFGFYLHWHEHIELHYLFDGNASIRVGEEIVTPKSGDCVIVNSNELHAGLSGRTSYCCLLVPPSFFPYDSVVFDRFVHDDYIGELIGKIISFTHSSAQEAPLMIKGYTCMLLGHLIKNHSKSIDSAEYKRYLEQSDKINNAIVHINNNYAEEITTSGLAEITHMSEGYFCKVFKDITGKTAISYLQQVRLEKAKQLLSSTDLSVSEIGYCCGFSNPNYFTRIFGKVLGITPGEFRKNPSRAEISE